MINLKYMIGHILYQILIKHAMFSNNLPVRIYVNKIENIITLKIKTGYCLEVLIHETMKFYGRSENKKTKNKNGKNVPYLEMTEVVLVHCNIANNECQH